MGKLLTDMECLFFSGGIAIIGILLCVTFVQVTNILFQAGMATLLLCTLLLLVLYVKQNLDQARTTRTSGAVKNSLIEDKRGILMQGIIAVVFITASTLLWLICALILNRVADSMSAYTSADPHVALISANTVNTFGVVIVVVDGLLILWWGLSAFRKERQEIPSSTYY